MHIVANDDSLDKVGENDLASRLVVRNRRALWKWTGNLTKEIDRCALPFHVISKHDGKHFHFPDPCTRWACPDCAPKRAKAEIENKVNQWQGRETVWLGFGPDTTQCRQNIHSRARRSSVEWYRIRTNSWHPSRQQVIVYSSNALVGQKATPPGEWREWKTIDALRHLSKVGLALPGVNNDTGSLGWARVPREKYSSSGDWLPLGKWHEEWVTQETAQILDWVGADTWKDYVSSVGVELATLALELALRNRAKEQAERERARA